MVTSMTMTSTAISILDHHPPILNPRLLSFDESMTANDNDEPNSDLLRRRLHRYC